MFRTFIVLSQFLLSAEVAIAKGPCCALVIEQILDGSIVDDLTQTLDQMLGGKKSPREAFLEILHLDPEKPFDYPRPLEKSMLMRFFGFDHPGAVRLSTAGDRDNPRYIAFLNEMDRCGPNELFRYVLIAARDYRLSRILGSDSFQPIRDPDALLRLAAKLAAKSSWSVQDQNRLIIELATHLPKTSNSRRLLLDRALGLHQAEMRVYLGDSQVFVNGTKPTRVPRATLDVITDLIEGLTSEWDPTTNRYVSRLAGKEQAVISLVRAIAAIEGMPDINPAPQGERPVIDSTAREAVLRKLNEDPRLDKADTLDQVLRFLVPLFPAESKARMDVISERLGEPFVSEIRKNVDVYSNVDPAFFFLQLISYYNRNYTDSIFPFIKATK